MFLESLGFRELQLARRTHNSTTSIRCVLNVGFDAKANDWKVVLVGYAKCIDTFWNRILNFNAAVEARENNRTFAYRIFKYKAIYTDDSETKVTNGTAQLSNSGYSVWSRLYIKESAMPDH